jgi:hypothetical protein
MVIFGKYLLGYTDCEIIVSSESSNSAAPGV